MQRNLWRIALPIYCVALIAATHYPRVPMPQTISNTDKVMHFGAFGILAYLLWRFLGSRASIWLAAIMLVPYAALDEYTQQFVGRHTDLADWIADVAGIAVVLAAVAIRRRRRG